MNKINNPKTTGKLPSTKRKKRTSKSYNPYDLLKFIIKLFVPISLAYVLFNNTNSLKLHNENPTTFVCFIPEGNEINPEKPRDVSS